MQTEAKTAARRGADSIVAFALPVATASAETRAEVVDDTLEVRSDGEGDEIRVSGDPTGITVSDDSGFERRFSRTAFSEIDIDAGNGNDRVFILVGASTTEEERTVVRGGEGNDLLSGGSGPETLDGGVGDDAIDSSAGDDTIVGGFGDDTFVRGLATTLSRPGRATTRSAIRSAAAPAASTAGPTSTP